MAVHLRLARTGAAQAPDVSGHRADLREALMVGSWKSRRLVIRSKNRRKPGLKSGSEQSSVAARRAAHATDGADVAAQAGDGVWKEFETEEGAKAAKSPASKA